MAGHRLGCIICRPSWGAAAVYLISPILGFGTVPPSRDTPLWPSYAGTIHTGTNGSGNLMGNPVTIG